MRKIYEWWQEGKNIYRETEKNGTDLKQEQDEIEQKETEVTVVRKTETGNVAFNHIKAFKYLGIKLTSDGKCIQSIKH